MEEEHLETDSFSFSADQGFPPQFPFYESPEELRMGDSYWVGEDGEVGSGVHDMDDIHISNAGARATSRSISSFIKSCELQLLQDRVAGRMDFHHVDLRALDYLETPNENLICAICASAFVQPMELGCGHSFCTDCLYQHFQSGIQNSRRCPKCREEVEVVSPVSTILSHLLDELEVECPNRGSGCTQHTKRYTVRDHVKQYCLFTEIPCSSPDCDLFIERRFAGEDCLHSYVECEDCLEQIMEKDLVTHQSEVCQEGFIFCRFCEDEVRRMNLNAHHAICDLYPEPCPGNVVGCKFSNSRRATEDHAKSCPMAIMAPHISAQSKQQVQTQAENDRLHEAIASVETRLEDLETICKQLSSSIKLERRRSMMPPEGTVSATRVEDLNSRIDEMSSDYTSRFDNVTSDNARLTMILTNENLRNQQQFHTLSAALTALRTQVTHLVATRNTGSNTATNRPATGGARGGGVALESDRGVLYSERREPPKL
ncbi:Zinc finger TRAF-type protein [Venturia nashicola]|uniref:Zinc finger TRAF-type n=1 Tax=Venturia nashicola TaxID=86259 RepID=A0A4Z1PFX6_9PEZI|nr:Zinc finger TRAF-type [Venturia nashicola]TLD34919.1 Zinc finger TRAF-type protein [Venturia nashicola]